MTTTVVIDSVKPLRSLNKILRARSEPLPEEIDPKEIGTGLAIPVTRKEALLLHDNGARVVKSWFLTDPPARFQILVLDGKVLIWIAGELGNGRWDDPFPIEPDEGDDHLNQSFQALTNHAFV